MQLFDLSRAYWPKGALGFCAANKCVRDVLRTEVRRYGTAAAYIEIAKSIVLISWWEAKSFV
jgi:hypothetical protein